jgi:hypothetical protein
VHEEKWIARGGSTKTIVEVALLKRGRSIKTTDID